MISAIRKMIFIHRKSIKDALTILQCTCETKIRRLLKLVKFLFGQNVDIASKLENIE